MVDAELAVDGLRENLNQADARLAEAIQAEESAPDAEARPADREGLVEEIEWYLLARLAAQRSVGAAGSVPLVLDDTFRDLHVAEAVRLAESWNGCPPWCRSSW